MAIIFLSNKTLEFCASLKPGNPLLWTTWQPQRILQCYLNLKKEWTGAIGQCKIWPYDDCKISFVGFQHLLGFLAHTNDIGTTTSDQKKPSTKPLFCCPVPVLSLRRAAWSHLSPVSPALLNTRQLVPEPGTVNTLLHAPAAFLSRARDDTQHSTETPGAEPAPVQAQDSLSLPTCSLPDHLSFQHLPRVAVPQAC